VITAVDTSVLLDVLTEDPHYGATSEAALTAAFALGSLVVCPVVWAEVRAHFDAPQPLEELFAAAGIRFDAFDQACADLAGEHWRSYRRRGGKREHLIPDFLIGAHAQLRAQRLLARDRGFFRTYFERLEVLNPMKPA
jgi:predicted nucleic acid-binding protein